MDHGGAVLWPHPPPRGGHRQTVCGCVHRLDDGSGFASGLHASSCGEGAQYVCPDHSQTPLQRLCTKVSRKHSWMSRDVMKRPTRDALRFRPCDMILQTEDTIYLFKKKKKNPFIISHAKL